MTRPGIPTELTGHLRPGSAEPADTARARTRPVPFRRLLSVEARKLFDTRAAKIMTAILVVLVLGSMTARALVSGPRLETVVGTAGIGLGTLLPVLGILTVTGEWSHRTGLTTFALEPRRGRVLAAKCLPPLGAAVLASLFAVLAAVPLTAAVAAARDVPANWRVAPLALLGWTATNVLVAATGLAMGMLLLNAPAAIVVCLSSTMLWSAVGRWGAVGEFLAGWFDLNSAAGPLSAGELSGAGAARLATSALLWIVVPVAVGVLRTLRREVR